VRRLGGRPLISWSIELARSLPGVCEVLVSTDDEGIAEVARGAGASVPWLRPPELATDLASSVDVAVHALDWYERTHGRLEGCLLLQPTSPFRSRDTVLNALDLFQANGKRPVLGVSPAKSHPMWCFQIENQLLRPFMDAGGMRLRSQDLPPAYVINGALYVIAPDELREQRSFFCDAATPLVMEDEAESIDIDTEWDWRLAESALAGGGRGLT
jgi:N-acylneuraminate cytidylyltransferase